MSFVADMITQLSGRPSPRLIWYGPDSERIELSSAVLANWISKSANFLVDFCDVEAGDSVVLDMPVHWRTAAVALAAWAVGAAVRLDDAAPGAVVTTRPERFSGRDTVAAVTLAGLAMRYEGDAGPDMIDYNAEVRGCGDDFLGLDEPAGTDTALSHGDGSATYAELTELVTDCARRDDRSLVDAGELSFTALTTLLGRIAAGPVALVAEERADDRDRIARAEGVSAST